jgi:riboflavin synthase
MFSGIVEAVGTVAGAERVATGRRIRIATLLARQLADGDSLSVSGVCLTIVRRTDDEVEADVGPETARITTLGDLEQGQRVNLERAVPLGARLGGHLVQGHVDAVGTVDAVRPDSGSTWLRVAFPRGLAPFFIQKGSVAVDGVSLTIAGLYDSAFEIQMVPFTAGATTLGERSPGDRVNLECDMIGKYVVRATELARGPA